MTGWVSFVLGNPVRYVDPSGHDPWELILALLDPELIPIAIIGVGLYYAVYAEPGVREGVTAGLAQFEEDVSNGINTVFAKVKNKPQGNPLQKGGNTITDKTLKGLGLTKEEAQRAIEKLKSAAGYSNNSHLDIFKDGDVYDPNKDKVIGNINDYVP